MPIIRRNYCISATPGICHSLWMTVWCAGWAYSCPKHVENRNKHTRKTVHQVSFIYKIVALCLFCYQLLLRHVWATATFSKIYFNWRNAKTQMFGHRKLHHHHHHHHDVHEGLGVFPVPWSSKWNWSRHLFLSRPTFLRPFGLYSNACIGIPFVSILHTCCNHFSWYCFISFTILCAPVFSRIHWFFSLSSFVIPSKCQRFHLCCF